jgi:undecaprenyl-phosphate 4-deoxy-4-formamido-L-arabinose transferase
MSDGPHISVVIPAFNEEENLEELVRRCLDACSRAGCSFEIILVDDGSSDGTRVKIAEAAEKNPESVVGIFLNRNYGQHAAVLAGLAHSSGDTVITLDADLQNPPEEIPRLAAKIDEGFDVVGTVRVPRQDSFFRRLASSAINKLVQKTTGVMMHDYGCMLRAYRRNIVDAMLQCPEHSTFIPVLANSFARRTAEIEVRHAERQAGRSKYRLWGLVNLQFDLLTGMTTFPLRLLSLLGGIASLIGIGFGASLLVARLVLGPDWAAQGVFTLFSVLFIFVGALFVGMGLLGEYLGRIYYDVRGRPRYFVEEIVGGANMESGAARPAPLVSSLHSAPPQERRKKKNPMVGP